MSRPLQDSERAALERLIQIAQRDTGQSRIVANFLLAWWNAAECGGFDLTDVWSVDASIAADMLTVFALLTLRHSYPILSVTASSSRPWSKRGGPRSAFEKRSKQEAKDKTIARLSSKRSQNPEEMNLRCLPRIGRSVTTRLYSSRSRTRWS